MSIKEKTEPRGYKSSNLILRLSPLEHKLLTCKAFIGRTSKSEIIRQSVKEYWPGSFDPDRFFQIYNQADDADKEELLDLITDFISALGYPHRHLSDSQLQKDMHMLSKTKNPELPDNHLQINTVGLSIANFFHHHMMKVRCGKNRTPYEQFANKDLLRDAIQRWMDLGNKPSFSGLRRILRTRDGVRSVVNFKPAIAQYFYKKYCPNNGEALDPCAGYGGRLTGCISTNKNILYHGIDPCGPTAIGNTRLASTFKDWKFRFRFDTGCAEDIMPTLSKKSYDLIFTSPPFFNTEQYSNEKSQSWVRYPKYDEWRDKFLKVIINYSQLLLRGGYLILNVKNYKNAPIADDTVSITTEHGFHLVKTYHMRLPNIDYQLSKERVWHTEPIFVFRI